MIDVLLVDDHALMRAGLRALVDDADGMRVVGAVADGAAALEAARRLRPDVVLMDLSMPGLDGAEATRQMTAELPDVQVLVLTSFADGENVVRALDAGAAGYLLKDAEPASLVEAVRAVASGQSPLDPRVARTYLSTRRVPAGPELTDREREVLSRVGMGLANKQIARRLGIREGTVKAHLTRVFQQIGVHDRTAAALWAREHLGSRPA